MAFATLDGAHARQPEQAADLKGGNALARRLSCQTGGKKDWSGLKHEFGMSGMRNALDKRGLDLYEDRVVGSVTQNRLSCGRLGLWHGAGTGVPKGGFLQVR